MELLDLPTPEAPETEAIPQLEEEEMERIAFELWQRGSLPEVAESTQAELDEVASHASCL